MKWKTEIIDEANEILNNIDFTNVTPEKKDVLNFLNMNLDDIKVVIIGQDPYPAKGVANGYAFAVNEDVDIPASLNNIFKEIEATTGAKPHTDRTLSHWTEQGVLLLNTSLTTIVGDSNSHKHLWSEFSTKLIKFLSSNIDATWVLWGNYAQSLEKYIAKGNIIKDAHPSPLSFYRRKGNTFLDLKKFCKIDW